MTQARVRCPRRAFSSESTVRSRTSNQVSRTCRDTSTTTTSTRSGVVGYQRGERGGGRTRRVRSYYPEPAAPGGR